MGFVRKQWIGEVPGYFQDAADAQQYLQYNASYRTIGGAMCVMWHELAHKSVNYPFGVNYPLGYWPKIDFFFLFALRDLPAFAANR